MRKLVILQGMMLAYCLQMGAASFFTQLIQETTANKRHSEAVRGLAHRIGYAYERQDKLETRKGLHIMTALSEWLGSRQHDMQEIIAFPGWAIANAEKTNRAVKIALEISVLKDQGPGSWLRALAAAISAIQVHMTPQFLAQQEGFAKKVNQTLKESAVVLQAPLDRGSVQQLIDAYCDELNAMKVAPAVRIAALHLLQWWRRMTNFIGGLRALDKEMADQLEFLAQVKAVDPTPGVDRSIVLLQDIAQWAKRVNTWGDELNSTIDHTTRVLFVGLSGGEYLESIKDLWCPWCARQDLLASRERDWVEKGTICAKSPKDGKKVCIRPNYRIRTSAVW
jgi:hypothetical protein